MNIWYIANVRLPTEKAHGIAIMKMCEAFSENGVKTTLLAPRRRSSSQSVFGLYKVKECFKLIFLPTIDLFGYVPGAFAFVLESGTFYISLFVKLLFKSRKEIIYTRDHFVILFKYLGFKVVYEVHQRSRRGYLNRIEKSAWKIVPISHSLENFYKDLGVPQDKLLVAPSGVDLSLFDIEVSKEAARQELKLSTAAIGIYTGNFSTMGYEKGIAFIIKSLTQLPELFFVAVGGNKEDIEKYSELAKNLGIEDRVILRSFQSQDVLAKYQKAADILLMPYPDMRLYRENMSPVKMFEYMVSKRPIIASDLPTIREVLNDKNAYLIPADDQDTFVSTVRFALKDPKASELINRAYEDSKKYSWNERAVSIINFLHN